VKGAELTPNKSREKKEGTRTFIDTDDFPDYSIAKNGIAAKYSIPGKRDGRYIKRKKEKKTTLMSSNKKDK
jgi:hypothetical protein